MKMDSHPSASSSSSATSVSKLTACLEEIKPWMNQNFLQLDSSKTEPLLVGTPHQTQILIKDGASVCGLPSVAVNGVCDCRLFYLHLPKNGLPVGL